LGQGCAGWVVGRGEEPAVGIGGGQIADWNLLPRGYPDDLQPIRVGDVFGAAEAGV